MDKYCNNCGKQTDKLTFVLKYYVCYECAETAIGVRIYCDNSTMFPGY